LTIPLGIDVVPPSFSHLVVSSDDFRASFDPVLLRDYEFSFVYCGSLDKVHNPSYIYAFCESIKTLPVNVSLHLFGASLAHSQLSDKFPFVYSHGLVSKSYLESALPSFDAALYTSSQIFPYNAILGNKIFDYIKANLPILFLSSSSAADFCVNSNLGFLCRPAAFSLENLAHLSNYYNLNSSSFDRANKVYDSSSLTLSLANSLVDNLFK